MDSRKTHLVNIQISQDTPCISSSWPQKSDRLGGASVYCAACSLWKDVGVIYLRSGSSPKTSQTSSRHGRNIIYWDVDLDSINHLNPYACATRMTEELMTYPQKDYNRRECEDDFVQAAQNLFSFTFFKSHFHSHTSQLLLSR